jgi:hypothetical protein
MQLPEYKNPNSHSCLLSQGFTEIDDDQKSIKNSRSAHHILPSTKFYFSQQGDDDDDDDDDDLTSDNDAEENKRSKQRMWRSDNGEHDFFFHLSIGNHTDVEREGENKTKKRVAKALGLVH